MSAAGTLVVFSLVEPLDLGIGGVWAGLALLQVGRLVTLAWRYQQPGGPLPMLALSPDLEGSPDTSGVGRRQLPDQREKDD